MLKQRIITAVVLLAILLPALFYPSHVPFACVMLVLVVAAAWEWGRLNGHGPRMSLFFGAEIFALCALSWWLGLLDRSLLPVWILASAAWVLGGAALLRVAVPGWPRVPRAMRLVGGLLMLWVAWLAAVQARMVGINFLLSILVLVWVADVFAYFAGRTFGLRFTRGKLAPSISPGKSWEGVWGGMLGVIVLALCWVWADTAVQPAVTSLYTRLAERGWWLLLIGVVFLAAMSVVGDLVESLIKRSAGAKDSSALLPGHGGVLDRVDALLPTLPIAMMLAFL
ncbi:MULTISPECIES: phosphatidate cytidylyltransferase [unclassified Variovorax]|uniref:phosphatidate cytidylyltransferase n=1 Tax=unclassified Variovorax TaxID=663243 RepID=UPI00076D8A55|nr:MULTISPECIES: phosphatidate cytidylyltransferase [unclassified Variovorax]KWT85194.1 Phosphatidate cytidylyltransferase [Variovorax sp. WDL1]PNG56628.1 Phosphatidate cytidylyltransferase [Variovorax sp. B4]PNG58052.1 Phosphatidate cytidylyltransferase [Variovorax sp. B2]VTV09462.1 Phosphatidate cytidylyltransferase [Variovorax sp. WDL1]